MTSRRVALLSLAATYLFFFEYFPPFKRVHLPYDLEGFHYPLLNYAAKSLGEGRFPEWDPSIYCGLSFAGNLQAGLFYPPNWVLFAIGAVRGGLPFKALEVVVLLHIWLAFFLCYLWLRRRFDLLPSALGAAVYAYSGYMVSQVQHYGVIAASAWLPLALLAIAERERGPRSLWKLAAASALAFLAGYPPAWFVFAILTLVYAVVVSSRRRVVEVALTLAFSLLLVSVQLFPALESAGLKTPEKKYGVGISGGEFYLSFFLPNYFNLSRSSNAPGESTAQYFYLGAPVLFALGWSLYRRRLHVPALALAAVSLIFMTNPFNLIGPVVGRVPFLTEICRDWNFLAGLPLAAALLTAASLHDFLAQSPPRPVALVAPVAPVAPVAQSPPRPLSPFVSVALVAAWCLRQFLTWLPGGRDFFSGWAAALDPAVTLAVFSMLLFTSRSPAALLVLVGLDYKVFGTDRRFNAADFDADRFFSDARASRRLEFHGLDDQVYHTLLADPASRLAADDPPPHPTDFRHYRLSTPQGFDPLLPASFRRAVEAFTPFLTDRLFQIDPANHALLKRFAVRYYLASVHSSSHSFLATSPDFRLLEPAESFFRIFEYRHAVPIYRWENSAGTAERVSWTPERRDLLVRSPSGGRFVLIEQYFPGWTATIDGAAVPIARWGEAFQSVQVPAGEHRVQFHFRSPGLRLGAVVSLVALIILCLAARSSSP